MSNYEFSTSSVTVRESLNHVLSGVFVRNLIDKVTSLTSESTNDALRQHTPILAKKWLQKVKDKGGIPEPYAVAPSLDFAVSRWRLLEPCRPYVLRNGCGNGPAPFMECPKLSGHRKAHIGYRLLDVSTCWCA